MPTLLDRLRDDDPGRQVEAPDEYTMTRKQVRDIVQRDLGFLLNTTNLSDLINAAEHSGVDASSINFGVPSLAGSFVAARRWEEIHKIIYAAIVKFEPRIIASSLTVTPLTTFDKARSHINFAFEVRGLIHMDPYPLQFLVQSSLDLDTNRINISGARAAAA